jgi:hypothetical protein
MTVADALPTVETVDVSAYDFVDFGAGIGGSIEYCQNVFDVDRGLGIDLNPRKVAAARAAGWDVVLGDARAIPEDASVQFVSMLDFLEHLPTFADVFETLAVARRIASEFIFIRHPSFEDEAYLRSLGLKHYWADWPVHRSHVLLSDFVEMFHELSLPYSYVDFKDPVWSSDHPSIVPLKAPSGQTSYDPAVCGPKPQVEFGKPVYRQLDIIVPVRGVEDGPAVNPPPTRSEPARRFARV